MTKVKVSLALASWIVLALVWWAAWAEAQAAERHVGWYGSISGGVNRMHLAENEGMGIDRLEHRDGAIVHGAAGYSFETGLRLELEGGYSENSPKEFRLHSHDAWRNIGGDVQVYRLMANVAWDFGAAESWVVQPYVEGGIGAMIADINLGHPGNGLSNGQMERWEQNHSGTTQVVPAWQVGVGASAPVTDHTAIFTSIRYFRAFGTPTTGNADVEGGWTEGDYEIASTSVLVGLRVGF